MIRRFAGFIELGLTLAQVGKTPEQIKALSLDLYEHNSHLQVAVSVFITSVNGIAIALLLHRTYGLATPGYLGPIYLDAAMPLIGTVLSHRALKAQPNPIGLRGVDLSRLSPAKALGKSLGHSICVKEENRYGQVLGRNTARGRRLPEIGGGHLRHGLSPAL